MHACAHTHTHTRTHAHTYTRTHTHTRTHANTYTRTRTHIHTHARTHTYKHARTSHTPCRGLSRIESGGQGDFSDQASAVSAYTYKTQSSLHSKATQPEFIALPAEYERVSACKHDGGCMYVCVFVRARVYVCMYVCARALVRVCARVQVCVRVRM